MVENAGCPPLLSRGLPLSTPSALWLSTGRTSRRGSGSRLCTASAGCARDSSRTAAREQAAARRPRLWRLQDSSCLLSACFVALLHRAPAPPEWLCPAGAHWARGQQACRPCMSGRICVPGLRSCRCVGCVWMRSSRRAAIERVLPWQTLPNSAVSAAILAQLSRTISHGLSAASPPSWWGSWARSQTKGGPHPDLEAPEHEPPLGACS
jgi:hypothetical protein